MKQTEGNAGLGQGQGRVPQQSSGPAVLVHPAKTFDLGLTIREGGILGDQDEGLGRTAGGGGLKVSREQSGHGGLGVLEDAMCRLPQARATRGRQRELGLAGQRSGNPLHAAALARIS